MTDLFIEEYVAATKKKSIWSDETFKLLKELLGDGHSAQLIADRLSSVTNTVVSKNAVIGKVHRSGLKSPQHVVIKKVASDKAQQRNNKVIHCAEKVTIKKENVDKIVKSTLKTADAVLALRRRQCRWPHGDPRTAEFSFCMKTRINNSPYCAEHHKIAFRTK